MKRSIGVAVMLGFVGCATTPNVTVNYLLPKMTLDVLVTRTVACDAAGNPILLTNVTPKASYSGDVGNPRSLAFKNLDGWFTNTETTVTLADDGRLKGINTAQTGQGGEIIKAAIAIAGTASMLGFVTNGDSGVKDACEKIRSIGKGEGVTLTFSTRQEFDTDRDIGVAPMEATPDSKPIYERIKAAAGVVCFGAQKVSDAPPQRAISNAGDCGVVNLELLNPATYALYVRGGQSSCSDEIWSGSVSVPQRGKPFFVPIPKAPIFGAQTFGLSLSDSGEITSLKYGKTAGLGAALGSANDVLSEFKKETPAETAAKLKAEADVIAQQQRLMRCKLNQKDCT